MLFICLIACRPDPGPPQYPTADELPNFGGPDPYEEGDERISLGIFYEMGASETYTIDNSNQFFYIWGNTFSVFSTQERIEGYSSDRIVVGDLGWWGGGVFWSEAGDFSQWDTLNVALKVENIDITDVEVGMGQGDGEILYWVSAQEYGLEYDNEWYQLSIPLAPAWEVIDPTLIQMPFNIRGNGTPESSLLIDNLYISKEEI